MKQKTLKLLARWAMGVSAVLLLNFSSYGQCPQPSWSYGSGTAPANINDSVLIAGCIYPGDEYSQVNSMTSGVQYLMSYFGPAVTYVTVYNSSGTAVAWGSHPFIFTPTTTGNYLVSGFTSGPTACGASFDCHDFYVKNLGQPCSAPPTGGNAVASQSTNVCPANTVNLSLSGSSTGSGLTYQWQSSPDNSTWSNITGATSATYSFTGQTTSTYYRCVLTCSSQSANSASVFVQQNSGTCPVGAVYSLGAIESEHNTNPTTSTLSNCPGSLTVTLPVGVIIDSVSVSYSVTAGAGAWQNEQRSYVRCVSPGGVAESTVANASLLGAPSSAGTFSYNRTGLTIANGVSGGGNITFELHNFRTWGGSACAPSYNDVDNGSFNVLVYYSVPPPCVGQPNAGSIVGTPSIACLNTSITVGLVGLSSGAGLLTTWQTSSNANGPWTNAGTGASYSFTASNSVWLRSFTVCSNSGLSDTTNAVFVNVLSQPLSGTYTLNPSIASSATNFTSFEDFYIALLCGGVNGAVTLNVAPNSGPYTTGFEIGSITGTSATNTITINGNGNELHEGSTTSFFDFNGAEYWTINDFNFVAQVETSTLFGILLRGASKYINITNNTINMGINGTSSLRAGITASNSTTSPTTAGNNAQHINVSNNTFIGAYYSVRFNGSASYLNCHNINIVDNVMSDFYLYGVYLSNTDTTVVEGNDISRATRSSISSFYGIYLVTVRNTKIRSNRIHDSGIGSYTAYPLYISGSVNSVGFETELINNAIYNIPSTTTTYGMYLLGTRDHMKLYHNTVDIDGSVAGTKRALFMSTAPNNHDIKNNIFSVSGNGGTGTKYAIYVSSTSTSFSSDNNVFFVEPTTGTNNLGYWTANRADLNAWQTASSQDANSVSANPVYAGIATGNISPLAQAVDNVGTPLGITTDIDGATRSATTPDAGAKEFVGIPADLALVSAELIRASECYSNNDSINVTVTNIIGGAVDFSIDSLTFVWNLTGPVNSTGSFTLNIGVLPAGQTGSLSIPGVDLSQPGEYALTAYIVPNASNASATNDTIVSPVAIKVDSLFRVEPQAVTVTNSQQIVELTSKSPLYPAVQVNFTEICHFRGSTVGVPIGGWPAYMLSDDYLELTGVPNADLSGYIIEMWGTSSLTFSGVLPQGSVLSPNGTCIIASGELGSSQPSPANYYYHLGYTSSMGSSSAQGYVIKTPDGTVLDAVGYSGSTVTAYNFPAAANISAAQWSNTLLGGSSSAGIRLEGPDNNTGSNWVLSANSPQNPNALNTGVSLPTPPVYTGVTWTHLSNTIATNQATINVGPYLTSGTYTYVGSYNNACGTFSDSSIVTVDLIQATTTSTMVSCNGASDGTATVSATGGKAPYTYAWSTGASNATATGLMAGSYTVTVTEADGDTVIRTVAVTEPSVLSGSFTTVSSTCGVPSGSSTVNPTGGTAPYTYAWSNGATTAANSNLVGGIYTVTVSDINSCSVVLIDTVVDIGAPTASLVQTNTINCNGGTTNVILTANGGTTPYTYAWSNNATTKDLNNVVAGSYTVTVTDATNCAVLSTITITQPNALAASLSNVNNVNCFGGTNGSATVAANGGTSPYTYNWSNGLSGGVQTALAAGTYIITVTDANNCQTLQSVSISEPTMLMSTILSTNNATCNGANDGNATVVASGGAVPYTYAWSNSQTGVTATGLSAGSYSVTVTDANGCTSISSTSITQPTALSSSISNTTHVACFGSNTGSVSVSATGGTAGYTYSWNNGQSNATATSLAPGSYTVTVTDANGCTSTSTATVSGPSAALTATATNNNVTCNGAGNGSIDINATGGTSPYTYTWSNGQSTATASNLSPGFYLVTITDDNGCQTFQSGFISEPSALVGGVQSSNNITCNGANDGSATVNVSGGTIPYTYAWSSGQTSNQIGSLAPGMYSVTVTDFNGCVLHDSVEVTEPSALSANISESNDANCFGSSDGSARVSVSGGTAPYSYAWSDGQGNDEAINLAAGQYGVVVTDANGCSVNLNVSIDEPGIIDTAVTVMAQTLMASLDSATYQWFDCESGLEIPGATGQSYTATVNGRYSVMITFEGCSAMSECYDITTVGREELQGDASRLNVFPNPNNGRFYIASDVDGTFNLVNGMGQIIQTVRVSSNNNFEIDLGHVATGVYYLIGADSDNRNVAKKIIVTKQ